MTQLFDTETYEEAPAGDLDPADHRGEGASDHGDFRRHLRSIPASADVDPTDRSTQWRLDDHTIETGRKGIQAARHALQDAAKANKNTKITRKAA